MWRALFVSAVLLSAGGAWAHPEIEAALARLNADIAARPSDAALYLERGELYARHDDPVAAEANYLRAAELAPDLPRLNIARAALELAAHRPAEARRLLDPVIARSPQEVEARVLRARALAALKEPAAAVADYNAALAAAPTPSPTTTPRWRRHPPHRRIFFWNAPPCSRRPRPLRASTRESPASVRRSRCNCVRSPSRNRSAGSTPPPPASPAWPTKASAANPG